MGKQEFIFKQFKINQDKCAMKIGTDSVLLGAWANIPSKGNFLDIGTGTGVLALMMAQRSEGRIKAVEIDKNASDQAYINFKQSKWSSKLSVINADIENFNPDIKFDYIICNPPFFSSPNSDIIKNRLIARHDNELSIEKLLACVTRLLSEYGKFGFILPITQAENLISNANIHGLYCTKKSFVKPTPQKDAHRIMAELQKTKSDCSCETIIIEESGRHQYSQKYIALTKEFYLFM